MYNACTSFSLKHVYATRVVSSSDLECRRVHWLLSLEAKGVDLSTLPQTKEAPLSYMPEKPIGSSSNSLLLGVPKPQTSLPQDISASLADLDGFMSNYDMAAHISAGKGLITFNLNLL
ncbi:hypothetical protein DPMN_181581 [Dreissena polymorpha]|uniref:Uncharacterized protein n=1 Tax=Dreissena polymorpha TaxID=45954 RepID=A0A9D4I3U7_DREPO|nr:hypothetical protein DPMN_181581 [Dreissena polymorpha]